MILKKTWDSNNQQNNHKYFKRNCLFVFHILIPQGLRWQAFSKNRSFTLETLLLTSGAEKSMFWGKCFFDLGSVFLWPQGAFYPLHPRTITQHKNREFDVLYKKCSFDVLRTQKQSNKRFFVGRLFSMRSRIIKQTPDSNTPIPITSCATF